MTPTPEATRPLRILIAKPGLDGHDRGAKVIARALRDAGMEVIYTGLRQTPEMIAAAALQEDVDAVGLSILSGAHNTLLPRVVELLRQNGMGDVPVFAGGIIPDEDVPGLKAAGIAAIFGPGTPLSEIVAFIREHTPSRHPIANRDS
ncbi:MAG: cobalamin B12-binding domain-containing protein [Chloroflexi bacterium]|jgi:methylmalonyl-CoA mutase C-terminal domain/subunit|uniref:Methylmalonyl-CoA mutase n=1 Tax=Candidatus Thermofonsia Clade 3 bacterium TaxID=2364212 RepID=A0A2M8QE87_9CHLR|nr:cobalamin B12-binding domain-containing protein [Candidatus Roseilinea sp. NK_OTU-006]PJF48114.1 MAG: methylmalonyl-CoA mutase [Candidatus Thermofonsia Clade 3 bacterium]RMG63945.1 MAG: cobalamin B12-binding domain-containing protein [Chloroflexota bacterium]